MLRFLIAIPLIMHGIGHITGLLAAWTSVPTGFTDRPWLFSPGITSTSPVGRAFGLLWAVAMIGLIGAGLGVLFRQVWWPALAMAGAVISLIAIVPWWNTVVPGAKIGALFDLLILVTLLSPWNNQILKAVS